MKRQSNFLVLSLFLVAIAAVSLNLASAGPLLGSGAPTVISYQGMVRESGLPYTGIGYFKFAVVNAAGNASYWSNDSTSAGGGEPAAGVSLAVSEGLFQVLLGDSGMTPITASTFNDTERYLRVWFSPDDVSYTLLAPDQQFAAVPYALQAQEAVDADTVDGYHALDMKTHYQNVVVVAKSGGDYSTIQAAVDSITDASSINPYLVWVGPGIYNESVTLKSHVHLQGAGQEATIITSSISDTSVIPTQGTLALASHVSVRDLTVENTGSGDFNVAVLATGGGIPEVDLMDVSIRAQGFGVENFAIFSYVTGTEINLQRVTALAENGSSANYGLFNSSNAKATVWGGTYTGRGGNNAYGMRNILAVLESSQAIAVGENASSINAGLSISSNGTAALQGGSYTGRGGNSAVGIYNNGSGLEAWNIDVLGENGISGSYGVLSSGTSDITRSFLDGGTYSAYQESGSFTLSHSRITQITSGSVTCVLVSRGSNVSTDGSTCP